MDQRGISERDDEHLGFRSGRSPVIRRRNLFVDRLIILNGNAVKNLEPV
jgi:hypothetical protein